MSRMFFISAALLLLTAGRARAQTSTATPPAATTAAAPAKTLAKVCARGVKVYDSVREILTPYDSVRIPPSDGPIRVSNEAEAEAAELALRARAGSVGATGVVITTEETNDGGMVTMHRSVQGVYVPADSARAQKACEK